MLEKLIVFAHPDEAGALLTRVCPLRINEPCSTAGREGPGVYYPFSEGWILVTGMGPTAAQFSLHHFLSSSLGDKVKEVWNLGFAGVLSRTQRSPYPVRRVARYLPHLYYDRKNAGFAEDLFPPLLLGEEEGFALFSSDLPIYDTTQRRRLLRAGADLVDMEGYHIAYTALRFKKTCRLWKVCSDFASPGGRARLQREKESLSERLADHLCTLLTLV